MSLIRLCGETMKSSTKNDSRNKKMCNIHKNTQIWNNNIQFVFLFETFWGENTCRGWSMNQLYFVIQTKREISGNELGNILDSTGTCYQNDWLEVFDLESEITLFVLEFFREFSRISRDNKLTEDVWNNWLSRRK